MKRKHMILAAALACLGVPAVAQPPQGAGTIEPDGTVVVPSFRLPPSIYTSAEAKAKLPRRPVDREEPMWRLLAAGQAPAGRAGMGQAMAPLHDKMRQTFGVTTRTGMIAGVPSVMARPSGGVPSANRGKILLNLPGGAFLMGSAQGTGTSESIPLAGLAKVEVVSITYRQAPEHVFPAASEDVAKVYRELLRTHRPQDIGIYGCSAGGQLTSQAIAWFIKENLPVPAAIGMFCGAADAREIGDSNAYSVPFQAISLRHERVDYFRPGDEINPLASPLLAPEVLRRFPPSLLITSTRAHDLSPVIATHRALVKAGVAADLHVWDGLGHAFFLDPTLPESREAFEVQANFFRKHLKLVK